MKKFILLVITLGGLLTGNYAQKETKHWYFGNNAAIAFPFTTALPTSLNNSNMGGTIEGCATISDGSGNLLFYTNGEKIWDKTHTIMPLPSPGVLNGNSSAAQSSLILPKPGSTTQYYVFSLKDSKQDKLRYSLVDLSLPGNGTSLNPLGNVISSSFNVLAPGQLYDPTEMLTACKQANNTDYWVISHDMGNAAGLPRILIYAVTATGVTLNSTFFDGNMLPSDHNGCIKVSPDRQKLAITYNNSNRVRIFNFDPSTGTVTGLANTLVHNTNLQAVYGVEFSPDSKLLYTSNTPSGVIRQISQFDLTLAIDAAILASRVVIANETSAWTSAANGFGQIQLGPDNRIYVSRGGFASLSYINLPNNLGTACGFVLNGIPLSTGTSYIGLPNYIPAGDSVQLKTCDLFKLNEPDTNCCSAGIARITPGNSNVASISFQISGGVAQGYTANCGGNPANINGLSTGSINFNPTCSLQLFNTSLQSTTAEGTMQVKYTVRFQNGDSCIYSTEVKGCPRSPLIQCDKVKGEICICNPGSSGQNYLNLNISNTAIPASNICGLIINYYNTSNVLDNTFFLNSIITSNYAVNPLPGPINVTGMLGTQAGSLNVFNIQAYYTSNKVLDGKVEVITIHCNGDTCKQYWEPKKVGSGDGIYTDFNPKSAKSPYTKISAYSFRISGPSATHSDPNPYKIKYLTINIPDSAGGPEFIGLSGAELFEVKDRANMLKIEKSSHAKYTALIKINQALNLKQNDSSGIFQLFFANGLPKNATFHYYSEEGSILGTSNATLDTSMGVGVTQLGKSTIGLNQVMLFGGYPNPTSDAYTLTISMDEASEVEITLMDIDGKLCDTVNAGKLKRGLSEISMNLTHLKSGTYFIQAKSQSNANYSNALKVVVVR